MIAFVVGMPIATAFLLFLWTRHGELLAYYDLQKVKASTIEEAKKCNGYWRGKPGREFTLNEKWRAYKRAKHRCERAKCRRLTNFGDANETGERLKEFVGAIDGHGGHRVPQIYGGGREKAGAIWLCAKCNLGENDEINEHVLREVRREGKKIYVC